MDVCETLLLDVVAPEAYQNGCSYIHELSGPKFDSLCINLAWLAVTQRTSKKKKQEHVRGSQAAGTKVSSHKNKLVSITTQEKLLRQHGILPMLILPFM